MTTALKPLEKTDFLDFTLSPADIRKRSEDSIARAKKRLDTLAAMPHEKRTFENTCVAFDLITDDLVSETSACTFPKYVSPDSEIREAAHQCETEQEKFGADIFAREDLYFAMKACAKKSRGLTGPDKKLLEKTLKDFQRNGLDLPPMDRARFNVLKKQLLDLGSTFGKNLNEITDTIEVTRAELEGLPEDFINGLKKTADGTFVLTMDYPDVVPFMSNAKNAEARQKLQRAFNNRGVPDNVALLEEIFRLRRRMAKLLGYASHAHYVLDERMAKSPEEVRSFSRRIQKRVAEKAKAEMAVLLELKKEDDPQAADLRPWDIGYYADRHKRSEFNVDELKIQEYFPFEKVLSSTLEVYQTIFGIRYEKKPVPSSWHKDVLYYETFDAQSGEPLGRFYLDLFPREGKYKHAAAFPLIRGRAENEGYRLPCAAMVANFTKPTKNKPSLLTHDEVNTLFHEFGHIMHNALTRAKYPRFSGTHVVWDFVEAPSQMLENWTWQKQVLKKISSHYKTGEPLPEELLDAKIAAKNAHTGIHYLRQIAFGTVDQQYHAEKETPDITGLYRKVYKDTTMIVQPDDTHPQASFGHLVGYDAAYYSYLWAEVFSADLFSAFEADPLNAETGKRYRDIVLAPGGEGDEREYVKKFLGREPGEDAFLKSIGLN